MYKELLRSIADVEVFPIVSLCLFLAVFLFVIVRAWRLDARRAEAFARLPFDSDADDAVQQATNSKGARL